MKTCDRKKIRNKWCRYAELRYRVRDRWGRLIVTSTIPSLSSRHRFYRSALYCTLWLPVLFHWIEKSLAAHFQTRNDTSQHRRELDDVRIILRNELWRMRKSFRLRIRSNQIETSWRQRDTSYTHIVTYLEKSQIHRSLNWLKSISILLSWTIICASWNLMSFACGIPL